MQATHAILRYHVRLFYQRLVCHRRGYMILLNEVLIALPVTSNKSSRFECDLQQMFALSLL